MLCHRGRISFKNKHSYFRLLFLVRYGSNICFHTRPNGQSSGLIPPRNKGPVRNPHDNERGRVLVGKVSWILPHIQFFPQKGRDHPRNLMAANINVSQRYHHATYVGIVMMFVQHTDPNSISVESNAVPKVFVVDHGIRER